jgi:hypothetical protein
LNRSFQPINRFADPAIRMGRIGLGFRAADRSLRQASVPAIHRIYLGGRKPGEASHPLMRTAISA